MDGAKRLPPIAGARRLASTLPFRDREQAGAELADALRERDLQQPLVAAIPRGGILVAKPVADALNGELDIIVVRKIGAPQNPELGLGAVGAYGPPVLDQRLVAGLRVSEEFLDREIGAQREEARRRLAAYRGDRPPPAVKDRDVVVVDDGIATGGTVVAAASLLRAQEPRRLILAVPVAPREGLERVARGFDETVCPYMPEPYYAVGQWYVDFHQVTDDEVRRLLGTG